PRGGVEDGLRLSAFAEVLEVEAVRERLHDVARAGRGEGLPALAEEREGRDAAARGALDVDLRPRARLEAHDERGARHVLEAAVLDEEVVRPARLDLDRGRNVAEPGTDQDQSGRRLPDRRLSLALEARVDERVLPAGRRRPGPDAVFAAR